MAFVTPVSSGLSADGSPSLIRRVLHRITVLLRKGFTLQSRVVLLRLLVPNRFWFWAVLRICRFHILVARATGSSKGARYESHLLARWLQALSRVEAFPIAYRVEGAEAFQEANSSTTGLLYCSMHVPLDTVVVRAMYELGAPPDATVAAPSNITENGCWMPAGLQQGVKAFTRGPASLLFARTILRGGGRFAAMLDEEIGSPLKPQSMLLAGRLGARVVFCWAEMEQWGTVTVRFQTPPYPVPDTEQKALANLEVIHAVRQRILLGLDAPRWGR